VVDLQNGFMAEGAVAEIAAAREIVPEVNRTSAALCGLVGYIQNRFDREAVRGWSVDFDHVCSPNRHGPGPVEPVRWVPARLGGAHWRSGSWRRAEAQRRPTPLPLTLLLLSVRWAGAGDGGSASGT